MASIMREYYIVPTRPVLAAITAVDEYGAQTYFRRSVHETLANRYRTVRSILSETGYDSIAAVRRFAINLPMGSLFDAYVLLLRYDPDSEECTYEAGLQSKDTGIRVPLMSDTCREEDITDRLIERLMS